MEAALRQALGDAPWPCLIETLLWDGSAYPRLGLHLGRLACSAARLGFACSLPAIRAALPAPPAAARVRLTLGGKGEIGIALAPLPPVPHRPWKVALAGLRLHSADPWLAIKSTRRPIHDAARAALPPGIDEAFLQNERGELCEGTISNIFFDRGNGKGLCTPPLACGLLPGVLRAEWLAARRCREEILLAADLPRVRLWAGNALRGLVACEFVPG
jgi:4-amino-4-deoxychorismate lyase